MCKRGFTMIEVIIAISVIIVGVTAAFSLINKGLSLTIDFSDKLTAVYLAQEGIEIVRNIRDTNWTKNPPVDWNVGLGAGDWKADYNDNILATYGETFLNFDGNFYSYDSGTRTKFRRKINVSSLTTEYAGVAPGYLLVTVTVEWLTGGNDTKSFTVADRLYGWYNQ